MGCTLHQESSSKYSPVFQITEVWETLSDSDSKYLRGIGRPWNGCCRRQLSSVNKEYLIPFGSINYKLVSTFLITEEHTRMSVVNLFPPILAGPRRYPPYCSDLFPDFVSKRSCYILGPSNNFSLPRARTDRYKKPFLFSTKQWCNEINIKMLNRPKNTISSEQII